MVADGLANYGTQLACSSGIQLFDAPPPLVYQDFQSDKADPERWRLVNSCVFVTPPTPHNVNPCTGMISALPSRNTTASFCANPSMDPSIAAVSSFCTDPTMDHRSVVDTPVTSAITGAQSTLPTVSFAT